MKKDAHFVGMTEAERARFLKRLEVSIQSIKYKLVDFQEEEDYSSFSPTEKESFDL